MGVFFFVTLTTLSIIAAQEVEKGTSTGQQIQEASVSPTQTPQPPTPAEIVASVTRESLVQADELGIIDVTSVI